MSRGKRAGPCRAQNVRAYSCEGVWGNSGQTTSPAASRSSQMRECLRRTGRVISGQSISGARGGRMSPGVARGSEADGRHQFMAEHVGSQRCEGVSCETGTANLECRPRASFESQAGLGRRRRALMLRAWRREGF
eukprot:9477286-Pyramimonas_sp.AAC.1